VIELEKLAAMQATDEEIAHWFGVSQKTVQRRKRSSAAFRRILEAGRAKGRISVRRNLLETFKNQSGRRYLSRQTGQRVQSRRKPAEASCILRNAPWRLAFFHFNPIPGSGLRLLDLF
jgi:hypothetical protein